MGKLLVTFFALLSASYRTSKRSGTLTHASAHH